MHLTDFFVPTTIVASIFVLMGLGAVPWVLKASRAWEATMLARWASENGAQVIKAQRLLWMGGRNVPFGFRVTIQMADGKRRTGVLEFPRGEHGYFQGNFLPDTAPAGSTHSPQPTHPPGG